jgi:hypothetical protein
LCAGAALCFLAFTLATLKNSKSQQNNVLQVVWLAKTVTKNKPEGHGRAADRTTRRVLRGWPGLAAWDPGKLTFIFLITFDHFSMALL